LKLGGDICTNDKGLPIVILFSDYECSHCKWIGPTFDPVVMDYVKKGLIEAHHYNETNYDLLAPDHESEIPAKYLKIKKQSDVEFYSF
jgi:thiol-disulfide isomerase/thioredoxin